MMVNKNTHQVITVAIMTTDVFNALTVDHTTVLFEGATECHGNKRGGELKRHEEDVDGDGDIDLVFHFRLGATNLTATSTEGTLAGETYDGQAVQGSDSVTMMNK